MNIYERQLSDAERIAHGACAFCAPRAANCVRPARARSYEVTNRETGSPLCVNHFNSKCLAQVIA